MNKFLLIFTILLLNHIFITQAMAQDNRRAKEAKGLKPGVEAPKFQATDMHGNTFSLQQALKESPVVVIFYRGHWCPVCNKHLGVLQDSLQFILDKGAKVVAVSPEKPDLLTKTSEITGAGFTLLYDEGYSIADAYDVTFRPGGLDRTMYNTFLGANLKEAHSDDSQRLPIPATFVIGQDGKIAWRHFDPDYKKRSTVSEILDALSKIN
jgi:peroxiredoxin